MHILLVRFSSMGDVVLQTATVNWLRSLMPEVKITFLTAREFAPLIDTHPGIHQVVTFDRRGGETWKDLLNKLNQLDSVDLILDLHATLRSWRLKLTYWNIPALTIDKRRWERFLLVKLKGTFFKRLIGQKTFGLEPQVERIIKDFQSIFCDDRGTRRLGEQLTTLTPGPEFDLPRPYVVLAPSASFGPKRWPIQNFLVLAKELLATTQYNVVVLAGPTDNFCDALNEIKSERFHNLQGKTSLKQSMSVLQGAKASIGNDTGMNHIAEAHGVPCLTIFGPTDPRFGFAPYLPNSRYLTKELWCKPCSTTGSKECFRSELFCMKLITPAEVLSTFSAMGV